MCNRQDVQWFSAIGHLSKISSLSRRMLDSDESWREKDRISRPVDLPSGVTSQWVEHRTYQSIVTRDTFCRNRCAPHAPLRWPHNQIWRVRAGEVCDSGEVNGKRRLGRHKTSYSSNIRTWMAESMEQISRDCAGWRRLVRCATPGGIGKNNKNLHVITHSTHSTCHTLSFWFRCICQLSKVLDNFIHV